MHRPPGTASIAARTALRAGDHSLYWRREYAELSVVTYDYHSGSRAVLYGGGAGPPCAMQARVRTTAAAPHGDDGYHAVSTS